MSGLDRAQLAKILARLGSDFANERDTAAHLAERLRRDAGMSWADIVAGDSDAEEAVRVLLAENESLRAELENLRQRQPDWVPVAVPIGDHANTAQWALGLHAKGKVWLSEYEVSCLTTCSRWRGQLTSKQQPILQRIVDHIYQRTGRRPP